jgi:hypothetical protein
MPQIHHIYIQSTGTNAVVNIQTKWYASIPYLARPPANDYPDHLLSSRRESQAQQQLPRNSIETAQPIPPPSKTPTSSPKDSWDIASSMLGEIVDSSEARLAKERQAALERNWTRADLEKQMQRRWRLGDVYAPHDLSGAEAAKWKKLRRKVQPRWDVLDQLGINPIHHYKVRSKKPLSS